MQISWNGTLATKRSKDVVGKQEFQKTVLKYLDKSNRRAFTGPVVIELHFNASSKNPPAIQSLPKVYLDLLLEPMQQVKTNRKRLLLKDDNLVNLLSCTYTINDETSNIEDSVSLIVCRHSDFLKDLTLYEEIIQSSDETCRENTTDATSKYRELVRDRAIFEKQLGQKAYEAMELSAKLRQQEELLKMCQPALLSLTNLYANEIAKTRPSTASIASARRQYFEIYQTPQVCIDFGSAPIFDGDNKLLKQRIRTELSNTLANSPLGFPLFVPCGISILYTPPSQAKISDIDNIARKVIPIIHEILKPPRTWRRKLDTKSQLVKQAHAEHINWYRIYKVPRRSSDPPSGKIQLILHDANFREASLFFLWEKIDSWLAAK